MDIQSPGTSSVASEVTLSATTPDFAHHVGTEKRMCGGVPSDPRLASSTFLGTASLPSPQQRRANMDAFDPADLPLFARMRDPSSRATSNLALRRLPNACADDDMNL